MIKHILPDLFRLCPISRKTFISVVIPVCNESENIEETLCAFVRQIDSRGAHFDFEKFEILVLANNCTDDTAKIIREFQRENPRLNLHLEEVRLCAENANIGFVRRALMNAAFERLARDKSGSKSVMMTTDGDTIVADDWLAANLREIERGADAVGGRIIISDAELEKMDARCRATHLMDEEYRLLTAEIEALIDDLPFDDAPRHHQHFNGSFAVKTEIYEKAGGLPNVKFLEDCAFYDRLQQMDARVRHSHDVKVYTSSRHVGRSEVGLSFQLNLWRNLSETGADFLVEPAESIVEKFTAKRILRQIRREFAETNRLDSQKISVAAQRIFVGADFITAELKNQETFGAFYENLMKKQTESGDWARNYPAVALELALERLKEETEKRRVQSFSQTSMR